MGQMWRSDLTDLAACEAVAAQPVSPKGRWRQAAQMAQMWRNDLTDLAACEAAAEQRFRPVVRYTLTHQDRPCTDFAVQAEPVLSDETDPFRTTSD